MVFIKRLELRGFKSFGSRVVNLNFEKGFTVITGPNGSGKSNILDAVTFCLGENNPRMLRVPKLTSLIYDGEAGGVSPSGLRVTVTLDNTDRALPLDSDIVTISRELAWSGESIYYLNGRRAQKNAVTNLLDLAMLTPGGVNFVPQGRVTRISELAPDEKRRLIEDLAGVAQFDEKKAEAMKQLHEADSRLQIALARIDEIRKRVESLEGERNDQLRLKHLEDDIRWLKAVVASKRLADCRRRKAEQDKLIEALSKQYGEATDRLDRIKGEVGSVDVERTAFVSNVLSEEGGRHVEVQFEAGKIAGEIDNLKSSLKRIEGIVEEAQTGLPRLEGELQQVQRSLEASESKARESRSRIREKNRLKKQTERTYTLARRNLARLEKRIESSNVAKEKLGVLRAKLNDEFSRIGIKIEAEKSKLGLTLEALNSTREKSKSFIETAEKLESSLAELRRLRDVEEESLNKTSTSITNIAEKQSAHEKEIDKALEVLRKAEEMLLSQEIQRALVGKVGGEELDLRRLEEAATAGALPGYLGTLQSLVSFNPDFEGAVAAAAGRWLRSVVVEDLRSMLGVAQMAKRLKAGRVMIIPLSEVNGSERVESPKIQGVMGNVAEFVHADSRFSELLNFVFGETIVVHSTQTAYAASTTGFRSVTPRGDLFESGGKAFGTGVATKLESVLDAIYDDASLAAVQQAFEALRKTVAKRRESLASLGKQLKQLEKEKFSTVINVERLGSRLDSISKFAVKYRNLRRGIESRIVRLSNETKHLESRIDRLVRNEAAIKTKLEEVNTKINSLDTSGIIEELRGLAEKRNNLANTVEEIVSQVREEVTELAKVDATLANSLRPRLKDLAIRIKQTSISLRENLGLMEKGRKNLSELEERHRALKDEEERLLAAKKRSMPILEEFEARLKRLRSEEAEASRVANRLEKERFYALKTVEALSETEQRILGELLLYGYQTPIEYFHAAEAMLQEFSKEYDDLKSRVNLLADSQYCEIFVGYKNLSLRKNQLELERNAVVKFIENVEAEKKKVFLATFEKVDRELRGVFSRLTGGSAWLELENPDDIFASGVYLMTQFPSKPPRESGVASGGEKAVASVSFILAVQAVYPSPIYIFDEVDANLDVVNSERVANLLKERSEIAQILVASLKDTMVSRATIVHGVYMAGGISQTVRYRPRVEVIPRSA